MNGWNNKPLLECVDLLQGLTYSPSNIKSHGLLVLRSSNIKNNELIFDDCVFVDCTVDEAKYVKPNDILICVRNGSSALIGKSCVIDKPYNATFGAFMSILRGDKTGYIAHIFKSDIVQSQIRNRSNATINQITKRDFEDIVIPIPKDEAEQQRITKVLSDTDELIATLEKLIAKKHAIKQGAVQELLTGKRRLPGFSGEWAEKKVEDCTSFHNGIAHENIVSDAGNFILITSKSIATDLLDYRLVSEQLFPLYKDDIVMVMSDIPNGRALAKCLLINKNDKYTLNQRICCFKEHKTNTRFLFYQLNRNKCFLAFNDGYNQTNLRKIDILKCNILIPTIEEQTAIASILSDMDTEIDTLTAKLNKLRNIKQGMMSGLLTGRIRLPEQKTETASEVNETLKIKKLPKQTTKKVVSKTSGHNQQFDDAVMIAGIVNVLYSDKYPLGRKKVQKCLYLLRRHQDESTAAFKKKAAGPYADEVRYKGGEPIAMRNGYIKTQKGNQGTKFAVGEKVSQALGYIENWGKQADIQWVEDKLKYKGIEKLELLATVDMAICDLTEEGIPISIAAIKNLIANNAEWKAKLKKQTFSDDNIADAIHELQVLLQGENRP